MRQRSLRHGSIALAAAFIAGGCLTDPATYGTTSSSGGASSSSSTSKSSSKASSSSDTTTADSSSSDSSGASTGTGAVTHPSVRWTATIGGLQGERLMSLVMNQDTDDVYIAGSWDGPMAGSWAGTMVAADCGSGSHAFVAKLTANGAPAWGDCFGDEAIIKAIDQDGIGDLVVVGSFTGQIDGWDAQPIIATKWDGFVARYHEAPNGTVTRSFLRTLSWAEDDDATGVVALDQYIYVAGVFEGAPTSIDLTATSGADIFLLKLLPDGTLEAKQSFAEGSDSPEAHLGFHAGNLFLAGSFEGTMHVGGLPELQATDRDAFLVVLDESLTPTARSRHGGTGEDAVHAVDAGSHLVSIVGQFASSIDFGAPQPDLVGIPPMDGFAALLDSGGTHALRGQRMYSANGLQKAIGSRTRGWISGVAGSFQGNVTFTDGTEGKAGGSNDAFAEKFNNATVVWSLPFGAPGVQDAATAIDHHNTFTAVGGAHGGAFSVLGKDVVYASANGTQDMFVVALDD